MISPAPPASFGVAAMLIVVCAANAGADPIMLLHQRPHESARVLIDPSTLSLESAEETAADADAECVALLEGRLHAAAAIGDVAWTRGRLSWEWARGSDPSMVYLICLDRGDSNWSSPSGGGLSLFAGLAWLNTSPANRAAAAAAPLTIAPTSFEIGPTPFISWPVITDSPDVTSPTTTETISTEAMLFDIPLTRQSTTEHFGLGDGVVNGSLDPPPLLAYSGDAAPVPEPATWLLMGTGLAAAWRTRGKHN